MRKRPYGDPEVTGLSGQPRFPDRNSSRLLLCSSGLIKGGPVFPVLLILGFSQSFPVPLTLP